MIRLRRSKLEVGACSETGIDFDNEEVLQNMHPKGYDIYTSIETALRENKVYIVRGGAALSAATLLTAFRKPIGKGLKIGYDLASNLISRKKKK